MAAPMSHRDGEEWRSFLHGPPVIVQPQAQLHYVRPEHGPLRFLAGGQPQPEEEYCSINEYACTVVSEGVRRPGVVRTRVTSMTPTAISREMAQTLGLTVQRLGGGGLRTVLSGPGPTPLEMLSEPLTVEVLDVAGRPVTAVVCPLVFVAPCGCELIELQLGYDVVQGMGWAKMDMLWGHRGILDEGMRPIGGAPRLFPRAIVHGTSSFWVEPDTYQEALQVVAARAAVRARRQAAAEGADPQAAGEAAAATLQGVTQQEPGAAPAAQPGARSSGARPQQARPGPLVPGSAEWVDEWLPAAFRRGVQTGSGAGGRRWSQGRGRGRGGRGQGSGGRGRGPAGAAEAAPLEGDTPTSANDAQVEEEEPGLQAAIAASLAALPDPAAGLAALPPGLVAQPWAAVQRRALPAGVERCAVCLEELEAGARAVLLRCRHPYCELCLRQLLSSARVGAAAGGARCPMCRERIA
ncbi:hypothetical protein HYH03_014192 [Edaphochlamys debaryana]|uniref:RING-type domain-containing protein n=1 Tax=Edaphochlamys debaryana TaxID=47281 RepID=A0A835XWU4_9CHLO|nr:hypothetical protein HYH03_014192 [Edaphochlamys debaryana]|eukprot:KAG2487219.1 hypothetical protein HYH03_014192 [Edaphochlamys debaryana]